MQPTDHHDALAAAEVYAKVQNRCVPEKSSDDISESSTESHNTSPDFSGTRPHNTQHAAIAIALPVELGRRLVYWRVQTFPVVEYRGRYYLAE